MEPDDVDDEDRVDDAERCILVMASDGIVIKVDVTPTTLVSEVVSCVADGVGIVIDDPDSWCMIHRDRIMNMEDEIGELPDKARVSISPRDGPRAVKPSNLFRHAGSLIELHRVLSGRAQRTAFRGLLSAHLTAEERKVISAEELAAIIGIGERRIATQREVEISCLTREQQRALDRLLQLPYPRWVVEQAFLDAKCVEEAARLKLLGTMRLPPAPRDG